MISTTLGHYRVLRLVGRGGMGEVYAAEDLKLGRTVAIKVLPTDLAGRTDDLDRFEREARAAAALNHPSIVTLHSLEQAGDRRFITMELVDGEPLAARIPTGGLPFEDVLRLSIDIADAVGAAHERGIVHRDLKPANVLITPDGRPKVLDFGLAKLREPEGPGGDEATRRQLTGEGKIVGTVAYMSPEQAEGRPVDQRTDIFSLGVMLYELATGQRPFQGDTRMSVLSAVIKDTPRPATELNPALPSAFTRILKLCLHKDPERRLQSAKDLRNELRTLKEELDSGELMRPAVASPDLARASTAGRWPLLAAGAVLVAVAVMAAALSLPRGSTESAPLELLHQQLTSTPGAESFPTLSPDGRWFLFVSSAGGRPDIYLQGVGGQTAINLTKDSPAADTHPAFSPDGESIAFRSSRDGGGIYVMGRTGEAPRRVASEGFDSTWSPDGRHLAYATRTTSLALDHNPPSRLRRVEVATGRITTVTDQDAMNPAWSPNGRFIAFWGLGQTGVSQPTSVRDLWVVAADGGTPWQVTDDPAVNWCPMWNPDGSFLYYVSDRGGSMNLWRLPMDPDTGRSTGPPQAVTTPAVYVGRARMSASGQQIVYEARIASSNIFRAPFDATRAVLGPVEAVTTGSRFFSFVDPSPDGRHLVLGGFLQQEDLYISNADGSNLRQITTDPFRERWPMWSPDSSRVAFYSDRSGKYEIWTITPAGQLQQITDAPDFSPLYPRWSPDGSRMSVIDQSMRQEVIIFDPRVPWKDQTPDVLPRPAGPGSHLAGRGLFWSPDGTQLAGTVGGVVTIYDIASRQYRSVGAERGRVHAWLRDGLLLVGAAQARRSDKRRRPAGGDGGPRRRGSWLRHLPPQRR
jgi:eukaryotic-like serine/threonine-protein kinase